MQPTFSGSLLISAPMSSKTASSAELMAVFKDCHQRLPKVLLK